MKKVYVCRVYLENGQPKVDNLEIAETDGVETLPRICRAPGGEMYVSENISDAAGFFEGAQAVIKLLQ